MNPLRARPFASPTSLASLASLASLVVLASACGEPAPAQAPVGAASSASAPSASAVAPIASVAPPTPPAPLDRATFNRLAVRLNLPLYWVADANKNARVDPDEVATLLFYPTATKWVEGGKFTPAFDEASARIVAESTASEPTDERQRLVRGELDEGRPTLVRSDFSSLSATDKAFVAKMLEVGARVDDLFALQSGATALAAKVPAGDLASQSLFRRGVSAKCETPKFESNKACSAIPGAPDQPVDVYPQALQAAPKFCAELEARKDASALLTPFTVVRTAVDKSGTSGRPPKLEAVSYATAYAAPMEAVAKALDEAAALVVDPQEKPLKKYLTAAARAYRTNAWNPADEAWAAMTAENSKWYVRVAPDETYWEPCSQKAGFHLTFARINQGSLAWQAKLKPVQQEMEDGLATLIGAPYKARKVTFHLPDFIDIVINSGDDRNGIGGTIGQSLPNWGPLTKAGRGRTVAMSNLSTDADSLAILRAKGSSMFDAEAMASYPTDASAGLLATILHEATHNLGPAGEYRVAGKSDDALFGGDLAAMLEELKAQTGGLYFIAFAEKKGIISSTLARQTYVDSLTWCFGHVARGMYGDGGKRKPYGVLAAIQLGVLIDEGALVFNAGSAANGTDKGAFSIRFNKLPAAVEKLMKIVGDLKAKGDRAAAEALSAKYADGPTVPRKVIEERILRFPQTSFVYAVDL